MMRMGASDVVAQQTWLDPISDLLQNAVQNAYTASGTAGQRVKNLLSGTWLGHPLHPAVTDLPVGSWTASFVLDMAEATTGGRNLAVAADATLGIGLAGSLLAALSGLSDWHFTIDRPRRLGVAHGLLNIGGAGLYGVSLAMRLSGNRAWGRRTAMLAYGMVVFSSWLGGELVFNERIGVDHATTEEPSDFVPALDETELQEGKPRRVDVNGIPVMLLRQSGHIYALGETCAHLGGPLSEGKIADGVVTCPWHASQFRLSDGQVVNGPAVYPQPCYQTRVHQGSIEVGPFCKQMPEESPVSLRQGLRAAGEAISGATS